MPIISGGSGGGLGAVTLTGTPAAGKEIVASSAGAASWVFPPGYEIGYAQITSAALITDTLEATATALISSGALTFDGAAVICEVCAPYLQSPNGAVNQTAIVTLFEGATEITRLALVSCQVNGANNLVPLNERFRFTPTAGAHTYKVCGFVTATTGGPQIGAGVGGTAAYSPAFIRFTKA